MTTKANPRRTAANGKHITLPITALLTRGMLFRVESQNRELYLAGVG
jgi:hypothetical protein